LELNDDEFIGLGGRFLDDSMEFAKRNDFTVDEDVATFGDDDFGIFGVNGA
jgi:hypothetical protein